MEISLSSGFPGLLLHSTASLLICFLGGFLGDTERALSGILVVVCGWGCSIALSAVKASKSLVLRHDLRPATGKSLSLNISFKSTTFMARTSSTKVFGSDVVVVGGSSVAKGVDDRALCAYT